MGSALRKFLICITLCFALWATVLPVATSAAASGSTDQSFLRVIRCFLEPRPDFWRIPDSCGREAVDAPTEITTSMSTFDLPVQGKIPERQPSAPASPALSAAPVMRIASPVGISRADLDSALSKLRTDLMRAMPAPGSTQVSPWASYSGGGYSVPPPNGASTDYVNAQVGAVPQPWTDSGSALFYTEGNVGIGTSTPAASLSIVGAEAGQVGSFVSLSSASTASAPFFDIASTTVTRIGGRAIDPVLIKTISDGGGSAPYLVGADAVFVKGNYLYVGSEDGTNGALEIFNISNPSNPVRVGGLRTSQIKSEGIFVQGNYAYVLSYGLRMQIIDVSNPANPTLASTFSTLYNGFRGIHVSGKYAYLTSSYSFAGAIEIVDISDPKAPFRKGVVEDAVNLVNAQSIYVSGNFLYAAGGGSANLPFRVYDISNPANPTLAATVTDGVNGAVTGGGFSARAIAVTGGYAYVYSGIHGSVGVFDVSNPRSPSAVASIQLTEGKNMGHVFASGSYLYVTQGNNPNVTGDGVLSVIDISNPTSPVVIKSKTFANAAGGDIFVAGNYAYTANGDHWVGSVNGINVFDIGGATVSNQEVGSSRIGTLQVSSFAQFDQNLSVNDGLSIGGNALIGGALSITGLFGTTTATTTTSGNPSLSVGGSFAAQSPGTESIFQLIRPHNSGISYAQVASFQLGSYATNSGSGPSTRLDFNLKAAANTTISGDTNVMSLLANGNVGISSSTPNAKLAITGTAGSADVLFIASSTNSGMLVIKSTGNLGLGTTTPGQKLVVVGNAQFTGVASGIKAFDLNLTAEGNLTTTASDRRLKENLEALNSSSTLEKLLQLKSYTYTWIGDPAHQKDIGLIAQDVETIFPELVFTNKTDGYMGINYSRLPTLLIAGVQELARIVKEMALWFSGGKFQVHNDVCVDDVCVTKDEFKSMLLKSKVPESLPATNIPAPAVSDQVSTPLESSGTGTELVSEANSNSDPAPQPAQDGGEANMSADEPVASTEALLLEATAPISASSDDAPETRAENPAEESSAVPVTQQSDPSPAPMVAPEAGQGV